MTSTPKDKDTLGRLREALRSFLFLFSRDDDGNVRDWIADMPESTAFCVILQDAHFDVDDPLRDLTPVVTVGQIKRAREALALPLAPGGDVGREEWRPIETVDLSQLFGRSEWVQVATSTGRVTEAMPFLQEMLSPSQWIWICARGKNCADPRHPTKYLAETITHYRPLPKPPEPTP